jgi:hypothetical protein
MFRNGKSIGQRRVGAASSDLLMKFVGRGLGLSATKLVEQSETSVKDYGNTTDK